MRLGPVICLLATPVAAQDAPMTGSEFARYVKNRTLTYTYPDGTLGIEQYNPDRTVLWQFQGQECQKGVWYEDAGEICFVYEDDPSPKCWIVYKTEKGIRSIYADRPSSLIVHNELSKSAPLICPGPPLLG